MARYVVLGTLTDAGAANIRRAPEERAKLYAGVQAAGGSVVAHCYTTGPYDVVTIVDLPGDDVLLRGLLATAGAGFVRTVTLRAFSDEEFDRALGDPPPG